MTFKASDQGVLDSSKKGEEHNVKAEVQENAGNISYVYNSHIKGKRPNITN